LEHHRLNDLVYVHYNLRLSIFFSLILQKLFILLHSIIDTYIVYLNFDFVEIIGKDGIIIQLILRHFLTLKIG